MHILSKITVDPRLEIHYLPSRLSSVSVGPYAYSTSSVNSKGIRMGHGIGGYLPRNLGPKIIQKRNMSLDP